MTRDELIAKCNYHLGAATGAHQLNHHEHYAEHINNLLDLLLSELVGTAPQAPLKPAKHFNPEQVLQEISIAIKHRCISATHRWKIILYHERLTCVPSYTPVPEQITLHEFTERMVNNGFSVIYWNQLKQNVIKLYKELNS